MLKFTLRLAYRDSTEKFRVMLHGGPDLEHLSLCGEVLFNKPEWELLFGVLKNLPQTDFLVDDQTKD